MGKKKSWIVVWKPSKREWNNYQEILTNHINVINQVGISYSKWNIGYNDTIKVNDCIFLLCYFGDCKGIFASGIVCSDPFKNNNIIREEPSNWIFIKYDKVIEVLKENIISMDTLKEIVPNVSFSNESSCIRLNDEQTKKIEMIWRPEANQCINKKKRNQKKYTGKKVKGFILGSKEYEVSSWKSFLLKLSEVLYCENPILFESFCDKESFKGDSVRYICHEELYTPGTNMRRNIRLLDTDIFIITNISSAGMMRIVNKMLLEFGYDERELKLIYRK